MIVQKIRQVSATLFTRVKLTLRMDKREQFGNRFLTDPEKVFEHNAWDNVEWNEEQETEAKQKVTANSERLVESEKQELYEKDANRFWDDFYSIHQNKFFKDRHWLFTEFPELLGKGVLTNRTASALDSAVQSPESEISLAKSEELLHPATEGISENDRSDTCIGILKSDLDSTTALESRTVNEDVSSTPCSDDTETTTVESIGKEDERNQSNKRIVGASGIESVPAGGEQSLSEDSTTAEFPGQDSQFRVFEVGCGVGNTVYPVLQTNNDVKLYIYCCDLSETAIKLVKEHEDYQSGRCHAFVCDITDENFSFPFPEDSLDVVTLIFVLSAIHPQKMQATLSRLVRYLKPGGTLLFRDYGRYDMAQLRFKNGRCLAENFYVRGDGTRVYFFTQEELRSLFHTAGLVEEQNLIDRRLQVNRGRQLKMYRVWIQCKYTKPRTTPDTQSVNIV